MANWTTLKAAIASVIKTNGNQEITGQLLQNVLNNIVSSVGENATFAGIATPTTNPGTPDGPVFYFAAEAGTYSNFGSVVLNNGLNILRWNGSAWALTNVMTIAQELGTSQTAVMSQKATTEAINQVNANTGVDEYRVFSKSKAYSAGDVVNYNGLLYQFTSDHAAGTWTGSDAERFNIINYFSNKLNIPVRDFRFKTSKQRNIFYDVYINEYEDAADIDYIYIYVDYPEEVPMNCTLMENKTVYQENYIRTNRFYKVSKRGALNLSFIRLTIRRENAIEGAYANASIIFSKALLKKLDTINSKVEEINSKVEEINSKVEEINSKVEEIKSNQANVLNTKVYNEIKGRKIKDWNDLQFGLFIHWGIYSAWGGEYTGLNANGEQVSVYDREWILYNKKLDRESYKAKQSDFTSDGWNTDKICALAKSVGMKYVVLTIRHHEGFSLYPSEYCDWDISTSGSSQDVVQQLKDSCDKYGLKFGLYYSYFRNWTEQGGYGQKLWNDDIDPYSEEQHKVYVEKQNNYINEIINKFEPYIIWFDNSAAGASKNLCNLFAKNQQENYPYCIFNDRGVWNEDFQSIEDCEPDNPKIKYAERCTGLPAWGYSRRYDDNIENYPTLTARMWSFLETFSRGFNYMLNIGPKGDGSIPNPVFIWMDKLAKYEQKYTFFNGCKRLFYRANFPWGRGLYKYKENKLYIYIIPQNKRVNITEIYLDSIETSNIKSVHIYDIENPDSEDNYEITNNGLKIKNYAQKSSSSEDDYYAVAEIEFYNDIICNDYVNTNGIIGALSLVREKYQTWVSKSSANYDGTMKMGIGDMELSVRFKWNGSDGNYAIKINGEFSGNQNIETTVEKDDGTVLLTDTSIGMEDAAITNTTSLTLTLENGKIYTLRFNKNSTSEVIINSISLIQS